MMGVRPFGSGRDVSILGCVSSEFDFKQLRASTYCCEQKISNKKSTQIFSLEGSSVHINSTPYRKRMDKYQRVNYLLAIPSQQ